MFCIQPEGVKVSANIQYCASCMSRLCPFSIFFFFFFTKLRTNYVTDWKAACSTGWSLHIFQECAAGPDDSHIRDSELKSNSESEWWYINLLNSTVLDFIKGAMCTNVRWKHSKMNWNYQQKVKKAAFMWWCLRIVSLIYLLKLEC